MNVTITIDIKELIYDIQNKTYLTGRSRSDGSNHRQVALMQANDDDENINQIMRSISNAIAKVQSELSEVLDSTATGADNSLDINEDSKIFRLMMPSNFNSSVISSIASSIHQFIVAFATSEWFMITNKPDTEDYAHLADTSLDLLRQSLCRRQRPERKSGTPTE